MLRMQSLLQRSGRKQWQQLVTGWKEEEKEKQVVVGRLPLCEEQSKNPGLDLEKYWEMVQGFVCILHKEGKNKLVRTVSARAFKGTREDSKSRLMC